MKDMPTAFFAPGSLVTFLTGITVDLVFPFCDPHLVAGPYCHAINRAGRPGATNLQ